MLRFIIIAVFKYLFILILFLNIFEPNLSAKETINIGVLLPINSPLYETAIMEKDSFTMALEDLKEAYSFLNIKWNLRFIDTELNPEKTRYRVKELISEDKISIFCGGISSTVVWNVAQTLNDNNIPFVVSSASADEITKLGNPNIFRICQPKTFYFKTFKSFISDYLKIKTAYVIHEDSLYGWFKSKRFLKICRRLGIKVIGNDFFNRGQAHAFSLDRGKEFSPELIYLICEYDDAKLIMEDSIMQKLRPKLLLGDIAIFSGREKGEDMDVNFDKVVYLTPWSPSLPYLGAKDYYIRFYERYGYSPDYHGAQAYATMEVIFHAVEKIVRLNMELRDALRESRVDTVYGTVRFKSFKGMSQQNDLPVYLLQLIDGIFYVIWPEYISTSQFTSLFGVD